MASCPIHVGVNSIPECRHTFQQVKKCLDEIHAGSVAGIANFLGLSDVSPFESTYVGKANWFPQVNPGATGLELHNLFGVSNTFSVGQTILQHVNLAADGSVSLENSSGQLIVQGANSGIRFIAETVAVVAELHDSYFQMVASLSDDPRIEWGATGTVFFKSPNAAVQMSYNDAGVTVGSLAGYIKGTAGLLSAVATIPASDITGLATLDHNHTGVGDGGVLTNDLHDGYMQIAEIVDPSNPPQDSVRLYTRPSPSLGSGYTEILIRSSVGTECVMCTVLDFLHANTLMFNDIEP